MMNEEIIEILKQNIRNINHVNTNLDPEEWMKKDLRQNKTTLTKIIKYIENPEIQIIDNPKPKWMPLMICDIVDLPFCVERDYSWEQLEELVITLSLAGCDGIRIFGTSWNPHIQPFKKTLLGLGKYSFFKPNPKWDETLKRFADLLHKYHMRLYVDLYDHCSYERKEKWNPFCSSVHNFECGFYGHKKQIRTNKKDVNGNRIYLNQTKFLMEYYDNRIMACLDPKKGDIVGFVNEGVCHVEDNPILCRAWAENWGVPRAKNIFARGFKPPIPFSGAHNTAQKLFGYISAEVHPELGWDFKVACMQLHGMGTPEHVEARTADGLSQQRIFSYTDDGVGTNSGNMVPTGQRGDCEIKKNGQKYACTADTETRIACVAAFLGKLKNRTHCHSIAFLPRDILYKGKTCLERLKPEVSADIYWMLAKELWGVNIKRTLA